MARRSGPAADWRRRVEGSRRSSAFRHKRTLVLSDAVIVKAEEAVPYEGLPMTRPGPVVQKLTARRRQSSGGDGGGGGGSGSGGSDGNDGAAPPTAVLAYYEVQYWPSSDWWYMFKLKMSRRDPYRVKKKKELLSNSGPSPFSDGEIEEALRTDLL